MGCVKKTLENASLAPDVYVLVTELGIEKNPGFEATHEQVAEVTQAAVSRLASLPVGPADQEDA
jgi:uncharacterized metal-binding protein